MASNYVVVLGAGAAGLMAAYYLNQAGLKVTLVEREAVGSHASGFAFGGLNQYSGAGVPGPAYELTRLSYRLHEKLNDELVEKTGMDTHYRKYTNLKLAFTEEEVADIKKTVEWQKEEGLLGDYINREDVLKLEPRINPEVLGAHRMDDSAGVEAYRWVVALLRAVEQMGTTLRHGTVKGLKRRGSRVTAVELESGEIPCDTVVVSLGPWSGQASKWLDYPVPVEPVKGQILRLQYNAPPLAVAMAYGQSYTGSKPDGLVWCGTTMEWVGFDTTLSVSARDSVMADALHMVPDLENAELALQTACLRPMSQDELPIIGAAPGWEGAYISTGAGRKGILWSTGMGRIVADLILKGETEIDHSGLKPDRFAAVKKG